MCQALCPVRVSFTAEVPFLQEDIKCLEERAADWQMNLCCQIPLYEIGSELYTRPDSFDYTLHDQSFIFPLTGCVSIKKKSISDLALAALSS